MISAWCASTEYDHTIIQAAPAEGKTFAMIFFVDFELDKPVSEDIDAVIFCP